MSNHADLDMSGMDTVERRLAQADVLVRTFAFQVEANAKSAIQTGAKTGRVYARGKIRHVASAPGQAPATDTGNLANSIQSSRVGFAQWMVGVNAAYGAILEAKNRPYLSAAVDKVRDAFTRAVKGLFDGE